MTARCAICGVPLRRTSAPAARAALCRRCAAGVPTAPPAESRSSQPRGFLWVSLAAAVTVIVLAIGLVFCLTGNGTKGPDVAALQGARASVMPPPSPAVHAGAPGKPDEGARAAGLLDVTPAAPPESPPLAEPVTGSPNSTPPEMPPTPPKALPAAESTTTRDPDPLAFPVRLPAPGDFAVQNPPPVAVPVPGLPPFPGAPAKRKPMAEPGAPEDTVTFLTSTAKGRRFCIIADCSGSMQGAPILYLKRELLKTLSSLKDQSEFYVIFFSSQALPMPSATWVKGGKTNVSRVAPWVQAVRAWGGTEPTTAFVKAFQLKPRPDVIFFMTDGIIPVNVPDQVAALNKAEPRVVVNTIMFAHPNILGPGRPLPLAILQPSLNQAANLCRRIADDAGGSFDMVKLGLP